MSLSMVSHCHTKIRTPPKNVVPLVCFFFNCIVLRHSWGCNNRLPNEISFFFLAFYLLSIHELIIADIFLLYV